MFSVVDYILFVGCLLLSAAIGIYHAFFSSSKQNTTNAVFLGNRNLGLLPVAMTLVASFISAISLLGYPAEIYQYGSMFCWYLLTYCFVYPAAAYLYVPVFYNLRLTSAYEILYMAVVLYAPAIALSSVFNIPVYASILATGLVATFYTSVGGAKAVVWTNTFQVLLIIIGLLTVVIFGSHQLGGIENVWNLADAGGRIHFNDFRVDPRVRHSFWSLTVGGTTTVLTLYAANQMAIQRYLSLPTLKAAQQAVLINIPANMLSLVLYFLVGITVYAAYSECDPRKLNVINRGDQLVAYYVVDKLAPIVGVPGLFVAALYSAGLSTVAGGFNSLAAVVLQDFIRPFYLYKNKPLSDSMAALFSKFLAFCFGIICIGLAFLLGLLQSTVLQVALSIFGMVGGPLLGVFTLGMIFPFANSKGALIGLLSGCSLTFWIGFGAIFCGVSPVPLQISDAGCFSNSSVQTLGVNSSFVQFERSSESGLVTAKADSAVVELYKLSYQYYSTVGVFVVLVVGLLVSFISGATDPATVDPLLLIPVHSKLCCCLPQRWRLRCGVRYNRSNNSELVFKKATIQMTSSAKSVDAELLRKYESIDDTENDDTKSSHPPMKL